MQLRTAPFDAERAYAAAHDSLTGLPNREHLAAIVDAMADESRGDLGLVVVKIDALDVVDAVHGRHVGDGIVVEVARRVERVVGPWAVMGQLERDRFALLLPRELAPHVLRRVRREIEQATSRWSGGSGGRDRVERAS